MANFQPPTQPPLQSTDSLPPEALALATRLFTAARQNDIPLLTQALTRIPPNLTNQTGDTLLMLASYHGHKDLVSLLLSKGADPNVLNDRGQSPLAGTVFKSEREVAEMLLRAGADPDLGEPSARRAVGLFGLDGDKEGVEGWGSMIGRLAGEAGKNGNRVESDSGRAKEEG